MFPKVSPSWTPSFIGCFLFWVLLPSLFSFFLTFFDVLLNENFFHFFPDLILTQQFFGVQTFSIFSLHGSHLMPSSFLDNLLYRPVYLLSHWPNPDIFSASPLKLFHILLNISSQICHFLFKLCIFLFHIFFLHVSLLETLSCRILLHLTIFLLVFSFETFLLHMMLHISSSFLTFR